MQFWVRVLIEIWVRVLLKEKKSFLSYFWRKPVSCCGIVKINLTRKWYILQGFGSRLLTSSTHALPSDKCIDLIKILTRVNLIKIYHKISINLWHDNFSLIIFTYKINVYIDCLESKLLFLLRSCSHSIVIIANKTQSTYDSDPIGCFSI